MGDFSSRKRSANQRGLKELVAQQTERIIQQRIKAIRNLTEDLLLQMEGFKNGHLLTKHAGKSAEYLKRRLVNEPGAKSATTFYNTAIATKAVRQNLSNNAEEIAEWLAEGVDRGFTSQFKHSFPIGEGFKRGTKKLQETLMISKLILIRDSSVDIGFRIQTGFPFLK